LIRRLSLRQVQRYVCGKKSKERIPTFEALLTWLAHEPNPRARTVFLNVEAKSDPAHPEFSPLPKEFASRIIALTKKYGVFPRLILQSFDDRTLKAAREIDPKTVLSILIADRPRSTLAEIATDLHAQIVSPNYVWLTGVDVESLHLLGIRVVPWTVDSVRDWRRLAAMGVDGIITDDPHGLLEFRRRYFKRSH
jgi:glycerophosphoryl diester phosphodiesterase